MDCGKGIYMDYTMFSYEAAQLLSAVATQFIRVHLISKLIFYIKNLKLVLACFRSTASDRHWLTFASSDDQRP